MDLTQGTPQQKRRRSRKMLLWFAMASMTMTFAGFTSAFVVSQGRGDWIEDLGLPHIFTLSTVVIVLSSVSLLFVKKSILNNNRKMASILMAVTFILGLTFAIMQFIGFGEFMSEGYYPAGSSSTINISFYYVIIFAHLIHVACGLIALSVLIYNHFKKRYTPEQTLGLELGTTFWHFLGVIWLYLFFFITFFG